jgi:hypothetical protein
MSVQDLIISLWSSITIALSACATWIANLGILSKLAAFATNHPYVCYLGLFWLSFSDEVVAAIGWPARFTCSMIFKGSAAVYKFVCKCLGFGEQGIERGESIVTTCIQHCMMRECGNWASTVR